MQIEGSKVIKMTQHLRAVAVCRCSTEEESQKDALIQQVKEAKKCIEDHGWLLVDTYVEAKSGTTVKGRQEYNRLFDDLDKNKFDLIVIKSQDRLMRNTKDWYIFLDKMQRNQKKLYIYLEQKFYTPDDSLITGIKAILAEEYSRDLSKKINHAHQIRQDSGSHFVLTNATYGYKKLQDKRVEIDEREVSLINMIFDLAVAGYGTHTIAQILYQEGIRNRCGNMLTAASIRRIIRNPIYVGDIVQNKKHFDFESKQLYNNPETEWKLHKNAVPAIVSSTVFETANALLDARRHKNSATQNRKTLNKTLFTSKIQCGLCHQPYYRCKRKTATDVVAEWKCLSFIQHGRTNKTIQKSNNRKVELTHLGCDNRHINEQKLYQALLPYSDKLYEDFPREELTTITISILKKVLNQEDPSTTIKKVTNNIQRYRKQKEILLDKLLEGWITDEEYQVKAEHLQKMIEKEQQQLERIALIHKDTQTVQSRINEIQRKLENEIVEQAKTEVLLQEIQFLEVFPDKIKMHIAYSQASLYEAKGIISTICNECNTYTVSIRDDCGTSVRNTIEREKQEILCLMQTTPTITAKELAQHMKMSISRIHRRIAELRKEHYIEYDNKKSKGVWIVLKETTCTKNEDTQFYKKDTRLNT